MTSLQEIISYLNHKKVPFVVKNDHLTGIKSLTVSITRPDQFYRANGKVICKNMALYIINNGHISSKELIKNNVDVTLHSGIEALKEINNN